MTVQDEVKISIDLSFCKIEPRLAIIVLRGPLIENIDISVQIGYTLRPTNFIPPTVESCECTVFRISWRSLLNSLCFILKNHLSLKI